jgi:N6-adenosine-specific RNA methylase IME4
MSYRTILADPPWPYDSPSAIVGNGGRGSDGGRASSIVQVNVLHHYPVMSLADIRSLRIPAADDAHLYLWVTNSFMVEGHEVARSWGFVPKTIITWVKVQENGRPSMKTGYYYRGATEHIIFAVRGSLRLQGTPHPTCFMAHRLGHSRKPDYTYQMIEEQSPGPYLELFARKSRLGWDSWGNEVQSTPDVAMFLDRTLCMEVAT